MDPQGQEFLRLLLESLHHHELDVFVLPDLRPSVTYIGTNVSVQPATSVLYPDGGGSRTLRNTRTWLPSMWHHIPVDLRQGVFDSSVAIGFHLTIILKRTQDTGQHKSACVQWILLMQDRLQWHALVNTAVNLWVSYTIQAMHVWRNTVARSRNHCYNGNATMSCEYWWAKCNCQQYKYTERCKNTLLTRIYVAGNNKVFL
jgi:hypothetical protein